MRWQDVYQDALKYSTRLEWSTKSPEIYDWALFNSQENDNELVEFEEAAAHMPDVRGYKEHQSQGSKTPLLYPEYDYHKELFGTRGLALDVEVDDE